MDRTTASTENLRGPKSLHVGTSSSRPIFGAEVSIALYVLSALVELMQP